MRGTDKSWVTSFVYTVFTQRGDVADWPTFLHGDGELVADVLDTYRASQKRILALMEVPRGFASAMRF